MEEDYRKRLQYYEYLLMDKIELLQAIEQHKREALQMADQKAIYSGFVSNAKRLSQRASFRDWLETSPQTKDQLLFQSATSVVDMETASIQNFSEK